MPERAFFLSDGERFLSTELKRGPWSPHHQHAGPPAALLGRAIEQAPASAAMQVARVTFDIVRPIPIEPLEVSVRQIRAGRSVELLEGALTDDEGVLMRASAWRIRTGHVDLELRHGASPTARDAPRPAEESASTPFFDFGWEEGYHTAMDARVANGSFSTPGPATVWLRMRQPLVDGEEPSPLTRVLVAADSGNGVSWTLDLRRFLFVNVDLSVHLHRLPRGQWVCLDAATTPEPEGLGIADTMLWDETGPIGRSLQTLLIDRRSSERA